MYVAVSTAGTITFRYDYRLNGRRETLTLGRYGPAGMSLAMARERLLDAKRSVAQGESPALEKQRAKRRLTAARTLGEMTERWLADARMADSTRAMRKHIIDRDILPVFQNRKLKEVTPDDLRALCNKVKARGTPATATGRFLLIPQGSRILGRCISQVSYGQSRVQVVWNRIILPDTSSLTLDNLAGTDPAGYAGLEDGVDWHWDRIFAGAVLTTLLGVGAELAAPGNRQDGDRIIIAGRDSAQDSINQVGQEMTRRNLNIQPTLTERPGLPVRIIVNRDLVLRPYQPLFFNRGTSR